MPDGTALAEHAEDTRQASATTRLLSTDDQQVINALRGEHQNWATVPVPVSAVQAKVDELFPQPNGQKCGPTKGYRLQKLINPALFPDTRTATRTQKARDQKSSQKADQNQKVDRKPPPEPDDQKPEVPAGPAPELLVAVDPDSGQLVEHHSRKARRPWPVVLIGSGAFIAVWSGWVGLGEMTGFGVVKPLPGIAELEINTAIALPLSMEGYATYALSVALSGEGRKRTRIFAGVSAVLALILGALGQIAYHLLQAAGYTTAPWQVITIVSCVPVICVGLAAALYHMVSADRRAYLARQEI